MATPQRSRTAFDLTPGEWAFLNDAPWPEGTGRVERHTLELDSLRPPGRDVRTLWRQYHKHVLAAWHPGTRPRLWWKFDAPEPRCRVGGKGSAAHDVFNQLPYFERGLPASWIDQDDVDFFTEHYPGWTGEAFDVADPPLFEAEATYLHRHDLLTAAERKLWAAGKLDTQPEAVAPPPPPASDPREVLSNG